MPARMSRGLSRNDRRGGTMVSPVSFLGVQQILQLGHELADVAEVPVNGRETDVRDLVELLQFLHDERADLVGGDFLLRSLLQRGFHAVGNRLERRDADRALFARLQESRDELLALEALAAAVLLHHHVRDLVDPFVAGKALGAAETFASAANNLALAAFARVDDLIAEMSTIGTLHSSVPSNTGDLVQGLPSAATCA